MHSVEQMLKELNGHSSGVTNPELASSSGVDLFSRYEIEIYGSQPTCTVCDEIPISANTLSGDYVEEKMHFSKNYYNILGKYVLPVYTHT